jgi:hypothetical protein
MGFFVANSGRRFLWRFCCPAYLSVIWALPALLEEGYVRLSNPYFR